MGAAWSRSRVDDLDPELGSRVINENRGWAPAPRYHDMTVSTAMGALQPGHLVSIEIRDPAHPTHYTLVPYAKETMSTVDSILYSGIIRGGRMKKFPLHAREIPVSPAAAAAWSQRRGTALHHVEHMSITVPLYNVTCNEGGIAEHLRGGSGCSRHVLYYVRCVRRACETPDDISAEFTKKLVLSTGDDTDHDCHDEIDTPECIARTEYVIRRIDLYMGIDGHWTIDRDVDPTNIVFP